MYCHENHNDSMVCELSAYLFKYPRHLTNIITMDIRTQHMNYLSDARRFNARILDYICRLSAHITDKPPSVFVLFMIPHFYLRVISTAQRDSCLGSTLMNSLARVLPRTCSLSLPSSLFLASYIHQWDAIFITILGKYPHRMWCLVFKYQFANTKMWKLTNEINCFSKHHSLTCHDNYHEKLTMRLLQCYVNFINTVCPHWVCFCHLYHTVDSDSIK